MFEPIYRQATHAIRIPLDAADCLSLFTPEGERSWVPGWEPEYLHPRDGRTTAGMVFRTGHGEEETLWTMVDHEPDLGRARYCRVTPGSRVVLVEIVCTAAGPGGTDVRVTYRLTGLSPAGNAFIERFVGPAFVAMIEEWQTLILATLAAESAAVRSGHPGRGTVDRLQRSTIHDRGS